MEKAVFTVVAFLQREREREREGGREGGRERERKEKRERDKERREREDRQTDREKETKKSCNVSCKNREVDKAVHQPIIDRIDDEWCIDVKGRYACVKTQCTIYSVVQIFRLVKVIQRKALC